MRSREFPLICLYVDVGIESKSILPFRSFRIVLSYSACSQIDKIGGSLRNETLSSYCEPALSLALHRNTPSVVIVAVLESFLVGGAQFFE